MQLPDTAICLQCGYSLRGLTEMRCPECGRAFDPNNSSTFGPQPGPKWLQRWAGPPPRWHVYGIIGFTFVLLLHLSAPSRGKQPLSEVPSLIGVIVALTNPLFPMLLGLDYFIRAFVLWDNQKGHRLDPTKASRRGPWRWVATPICLLLIYVAGGQSWPLQLRFYLSRPAFDHAAQAYLQAPGSPNKPRWVGLYHVRRISGYGPGTVVFEIEAGGKGVDAVGFVYDPAPSPSRRYGPSIAPGWYIEWW